MRVWVALVPVLLLAVVAGGCVPSLKADESAELACPTTSGPVADNVAVMSAVRSEVERRLGQPVRLASPEIRRYRGSGQASFAYFTAEPVRPDGSAIDYRSLPEFAPQVAAGAFDKRTEALLRFDGGSWRALEVRIGATDTKLDAWKQQYGIR